MSDEEEEYEVQVVQEAEFRLLDSGDEEETMCYLARWWGYGPESDTWEPEENFGGGSKALLDRFWRSVGVNRRDASAEHRYVADGTWIRQEMKHFKKDKDGTDFNTLVSGDEDVDDAKIKSSAKDATKSKKGTKEKGKDKERGNEVKHTKKIKIKKPAVDLEPKKDDKKKAKEKEKEIKDNEQHKKGAFDFDMDDSPVRPPKKDKTIKPSSHKRTRITSSSDDDDDVPLAALIRPKKKKKTIAQSVTAESSKAGAGPGPLFHAPSPDGRAETPEEFFSTVTPSTVKELHKTKRESFTPPLTSSEGTTKDRPFISQKEVDRPAAGEPGSSRPPGAGEPTRQKRPSISHPSQTKPISSADALASASPSSVDQVASASPTAMEGVSSTSKPPSSQVPPLPQPSRNTSDIVLPTPGVNKHRGSRLKMLSDKSDVVQAVPPERPIIMRPIGGKYVKVKVKPSAPVKPQSSVGSSGPAPTPTSAPAHSPASPNRPRGSSISSPKTYGSAFSPSSDSRRPSNFTHASPMEQQRGPNQWSDAPIATSPAQHMALDDITGMVDDAFATHGAGPSGSHHVSVNDPDFSGAMGGKPPTEDTRETQIFLENLFIGSPQVQAHDPPQTAWSGTLRLPTSSEVTHDLQVVLADVVSEPSAPPLTTVVIDSAIQLNGLYSTNVYLEFIQPAFGAPTHFAAVNSESEADVNRLRRLVAFLRDTNQVAIAFFKSSGGTAKSPYMLVVFPSEHATLRQSLAIPHGLASLPDTLLVAIVKQVDPIGFTTRGPTSSRSTVVTEETPWKQRAVSMLGLTPEHDQTFRGVNYAFFPDDRREDVDCNAKTLDTYLTDILGAKRVPYDGYDAQHIFIHAKGRHRLTKFTKLQELRREAPQISFHAFGWDIGVDPATTHLRSIWEIGGILAFTPRAILEHADKIRKLLDNAQEDPFWEIYLTPGVIALVDELSALQLDESAYAKDALYTLLPLFSKGKRGHPNITLGMPSSDMDPVIWAYNQMRISEQPLPEVLEDCARSFREKYSSMLKANGPLAEAAGGKLLLNRATPSQISAVERAVEKELIWDLQLLQLKPELSMYRRCVLIAGEAQAKPGSIPIEVLTPSSFDFGCKSFRQVM